MNELKEILVKAEEEREQMLLQLSVLEKTEEVKKYLLLKDKSASLFFECQELIKRIKLEEFESCNHIWITTNEMVDKNKGRSCRFLGCIKCGLDQDVINKLNTIHFLPYEEQLMCTFMENSKYITGIVSFESCDLSLARAIYSKIKEKNPDIDDETACKYFEIALNNMRDKRVNDEKRKSITKRLSLKPHFNK